MYAKVRNYGRYFSQIADLQAASPTLGEVQSETQTHCLANGVIRYEFTVYPCDVQVSRFVRGERMAGWTLSKERAREVYKGLLSKSYSKF